MSYEHHGRCFVTEDRSGGYIKQVADEIPEADSQHFCLGLFPRTPAIVVLLTLLLKSRMKVTIQVESTLMKHTAKSCLGN
ncbi:hypothetical protein VNO77_18766 [Canavalia gladiata]|uniref:Uncharacterized protein n=1 Tax=Canavalia gladiata TaxID=3824 RepID=A0AAN9QKN7_CANGL